MASNASPAVWTVTAEFPGGEYEELDITVDTDAPESRVRHLAATELTADYKPGWIIIGCERRFGLFI